jgi:O-antigen ligase
VIEPAAAPPARPRARSFPLWFGLLPLAMTVMALGAANQPKLLLGALAAVCVLVLAFRRPVANLALLVFLTAVVPFQTLNRFGIGGGLNSPGLLFSDIFLLSGLAWAAFALPRLPLDRRRYLYTLAMLLFVVLVVIQTLHGVRAGYNRSTLGQEGRVLLGFGTFLMALPLLAHAPSRRRLLGALGVIALLLGAWGMLQWVGHFTLGAAGDVGVRAGVRLTSGGSGQLQGGEFGYPVAIIVCFAALALGELRSQFWRLLLLTAIALNTASCLVTFERTFWLDAMAGIVFVLAFARGRRVKILAGLGAAAVVAALALSVLMPGTLTTAHQRLNSIGGYASDSSVRYRVVESGFVYDQIQTHPLTGSGVGATIFWGQPWAKVPPKTRNFAHNGYFWLAWKLGVPAAAVLVLLFATSVLGRRVADEEPLSIAVRRGAQGAVAGLLLATMTFPSFSQLSIAPTMGLLLAIAVSPAVRSRDAASAQPRPVSTPALSFS